MNFSSSVHGDLIPGADSKTWIIAWPKVHQTFAGRGISLFVQRSGDGEAVGNTSGKLVCGVSKDGRVDIDSGSFGS